MPRLPGRNQSESFPKERLRDLRTTRKHLSENFLSHVVTREPSASRARNCSTELHRNWSNWLLVKSDNSSHALHSLFAIPLAALSCLAAEIDREIVAVSP
jgi:hypothetical protein